MEIIGFKDSWIANKCQKETWTPKTSHFLAGLYSYISLIVKTCMKIVPLKRIFKLD